MEQSDLNELIKLSHEASVSPNTRYDLDYLEHYLRCALDLSKFSQDERARLADQYQGLPDEDKAYLVNRVFNRTHPIRFHLSEPDAKKLNAAREELCFHERAQLSAVYDAQNGIAWLDIGKVFDARIEIDDHSSPEPVCACVIQGQCWVRLARRNGRHFGICRTKRIRDRQPHNRRGNRTLAAGSLFKTHS